MKENIKIEDLCKRIDLENLSHNEKTALYYAFDEELNKLRAGNILNENYPHIKLQGGYSGAAGQDQNSLILLFMLKRILISVSNQEVLIQQNQEIINLLREIKDK